MANFTKKMTLIQFQIHSGKRLKGEHLFVFSIKTLVFFPGVFTFSPV